MGFKGMLVPLVAFTVTFRGPPLVRSKKLPGSKLAVVTTGVERLIAGDFLGRALMALTSREEGTFPQRHHCTRSQCDKCPHGETYTKESVSRHRLAPLDHCQYQSRRPRPQRPILHRHRGLWQSCLNHSHAHL